MAAVYHGVVRDNRVELEGDAQLRDGLQVEVRPVPEQALSSGGAAAEAERALVEDLLAAGLLDEAPEDGAVPAVPFEPVNVRGRPLSEQIIEERR